MAESDLAFLLKSYRFFDQALSAHGPAMVRADKEQLQDERAATFGKLLTQVSDNPSISLLQLRALLDCLAHAPHDAELAKRIVDVSRQHVDQLSRSLPSPSQDASWAVAGRPSASPVRWPDAERLQMFDAAADRIVILDTEYRYQFANTANAAFHDKPAQAFIDKPLWAMTCEKFFERMTKPAFDRCFAGQAFSYVAPHPGRNPNELHSAHLDPIADGTGKVIGALVVVKPVWAVGASA